MENILSVPSLDHRTLLQEQMFICNKEMFYTAYQLWPDRKRDYVSRFLAEEFLVDRQGEWERLYGGAVPDAGEPEEATDPPTRTIDSKDWTGVPL